MQPYIKSKGYYLDYRHPRPTRRHRSEVVGIDYNGNRHKLDIVIEKNGSETQKGSPKAFIEVAWRRYSKHSKNKVQEISGAILPLVQTHLQSMPFYCAVLAGVFTASSIQQLESEGFYVLHFTYEEIAQIFDTADLSIRWDEKTSEAQLKTLSDRLSQLSQPTLDALQDEFFKQQRNKLSDLRNQLDLAFNLAVSEIIVLPTHGTAYSLPSVHEAISFIAEYDESKSSPILRYEITIRYNQNLEYTMKCTDKTQAIRFLQPYMDKA
ncbi:MAG: hypothetical protein Q4G52_09370 [Clostridia bacterium]|nr:hypothetical protein [Clostridia bacterium]